MLLVWATERRALSNINAALVVALSGAAAVLVARGYGPPLPRGCCPECCRTRSPARADGPAEKRPSRRSVQASPRESGVTGEIP